MNDIKMGTQWVNRNNGRWVTVVSTISAARYMGAEQVRIADSTGREISVNREHFDSTFTLVTDPEHPYPGETWSVGYEVVAIKTVSDGYVVYENKNGRLSTWTVDGFLTSSVRGERGRPLPKLEGPRHSVYLPAWEHKGRPASDDDTGFVITNQIFKSPQEIKDEKPWRMIGIMRVPLAWDHMEWVE